MDNEWRAVEVARRSGTELFRLAGEATEHSLLEFWRWSSSDLLSNATRGVLAEYIVGLALGCAGGTRREWDATDLLTPDGLRIEVKSAAYLQTWAQARPSRIAFGIQPTTGWDAATNSLSEARMRQADVYVFALLHHQEKSTVDPLDLDQWTFHAVSTLKLNRHVPEQRSIGLASLMGLGPEVVPFDGLPGAVSRAYAHVREH